MPSEVLLDVEYLPGTPGDGLEPVRSAARADEPGLAILRKSACLNCHADKTSLVGPSFSAIADKYGDSEETIARLGRHIRNGSSGSWGSLPAFAAKYAANAGPNHRRRGLPRLSLCHAGLRACAHLPGVRSNHLSLARVLSRSRRLLSTDPGRSSPTSQTTNRFDWPDRNRRPGAAGSVARMSFVRMRREPRRATRANGRRAES